MLPSCPLVEMELHTSDLNERQFEQTTSRDAAISGGMYIGEKMVENPNDDRLSVVAPTAMLSPNITHLDTNCSNNNNWQVALQNLKPTFQCNFVKRELTRTQSDSSGFGSFRSDSFINSNTNYDLNDLSRDLFEDGCSDNQTGDSRTVSPECNIGADSDGVGQTGVICNSRAPKMGCGDSPRAAKRSRITRNIPDRGTWQEHCNRIENNLNWLKAELKLMRSQDDDLLFLLTRCQSSISCIKRDKESALIRARLCGSPGDGRHWEEWEINDYERRRQAGEVMSPSPVKQKQPVRSHPMSPAHRMYKHAQQPVQRVHSHAQQPVQTVHSHTQQPVHTLNSHTQPLIETANRQANPPTEAVVYKQPEPPAQTNLRPKVPEPPAQTKLKPKLPPKPTRLMPTRLIYRDDTEIMV